MSIFSFLFRKRNPDTTKISPVANAEHYRQLWLKRVACASQRGDVYAEKCKRNCCACLMESVREYEKVINWHTCCPENAKMLDQLYTAEAYIDQLKADREKCKEIFEKRWSVADGDEPSDLLQIVIDAFGHLEAARDGLKTKLSNLEEKSTDLKSMRELIQEYTDACSCYPLQCLRCAKAAEIITRSSNDR